MRLMERNRILTSKRGLSKPFFYFLSAALITATLVGVWGCGPKDKGAAIFKHDSVQVSEKHGGLNFKIIDFDWRYDPGLKIIEVKGTAINESGRNLQACRILATGHDEYDDLIGTAESFITPTYISDGKKVKFILLFSNGRDIRVLRLQCRFLSRIE